MRIGTTRRQLVDTVLTDEYGAYHFDGREVGGKYQLQFELPDGFVFAEPDQSLDEGIDSDADVTNGRTPSFTARGGWNTGWDAGMVQLGEIEGIAWHDLDGDGQVDADESPVTGTTVFLDANRNETRDDDEPSVVTGADGAYAFDHVRPGAWLIRTIADAKWKSREPVAIDLASGEQRDALHLAFATWNQRPTAITLDALTISENLSGQRVGRIGVEDPDAGDTHELRVDDSRFVIRDGWLSLAPAASVSYDVEPTIPIKLTAVDSGDPTLEWCQTFQLQVQPNPHPWQNPTTKHDVNGDGVVTPLDVLVIINLLNGLRADLIDDAGQLPAARPAETVLAYYDANADGFVTALDVLVIVNNLNEDE